jgi:hypothetical protein
VVGLEVERIMSKYDLRTPRDLFQQIEAAVLRNPSRLSMHHYHELAGVEVVEDPLKMLAPNCAHCLFGWIIAYTPGAVELEADGEDPMDLANAILISNSRLSIPRALAFSDEESALKIIRGRAAEERAAERAVAYGPS